MVHRALGSLGPLGGLRGQTCFHNHPNVTCIFTVWTASLTVQKQCGCNWGCLRGNQGNSTKHRTSPTQPQKDAQFHIRMSHMKDKIINFITNKHLSMHFLNLLWDKKGSRPTTPLLQMGGQRPL